MERLEQLHKIQDLINENINTKNLTDDEVKTYNDLITIIDFEIDNAEYWKSRSTHLP